MAGDCDNPTLQTMDMDHTVLPPAHDATLTLVLGSDSEESAEHDKDKDGNWFPMPKPPPHASSAKKNLKSRRISFYSSIDASGSDHDAEGEASEEDFCLIEDYRKRVASRKKKGPAAVNGGRQIVHTGGINTGMYNEVEKKLFAEGIELYGRDWSKVTNHVGTRDVESVRSH
ncbi:hypothetical protein BJ742DRAFT_868583, partial [Cladochytrium replicatum]